MANSRGMSPGGRRRRNARRVRSCWGRQDAGSMEAPNQKSVERVTFSQAV